MTESELACTVGLPAVKPHAHDAAGPEEEERSRGALAPRGRTAEDLALTGQETTRMADADEINADQLAYWNGAGGHAWAERQAHTDVVLAPASKPLLALAAPRRGERVLDVGCGCGSSTLELARAVGATGRVTALDISAPMLALAQARARTAGITHVDWRQADAATAALDEFDLLVSSFGLMFFGDPLAAFAHLRRAASPSARMAFVCWRPLSENPWLDVPLQAVLAHFPPSPPPAPHAPGMFSLADRQHLSRVLTAAGWAPPRIDPLDLELDVAAGQGFDEAVAQLTKLGVINSWLSDEPASTVAAATASLREALQPYRDGASVRLPGAMWLVSSAPG